MILPQPRLELDVQKLPLSLPAGLGGAGSAVSATWAVPKQNGFIALRWNALFNAENFFPLAEAGYHLPNGGRTRISQA